MNEPSSGSLVTIDTLADVPIPIEVRLGCRSVTLEEIAGLEIGGVIPLGTPAGTALDLFAGSLLLASAEPVAVEDRLAIRVTDIFTPGPAAGSLS